MENAGFPVKADYLESVLYRPHINVDIDLWGKKIDWYREWITSTNESDPYWQSGFWKELKEIPGKIKLPVYIGGGWYDHHLGSTLKTYETLSKESKQHSVLRIGAWNHAFQPCVEGIVAKHLENSNIKSSFEWFDTILRKKQLPKGCVYTYRIGGDSWQENAAYPFPKKCERIYYLSGIVRDNNSYLLASACDKQEGSVTYLYDPDKPVMSHGAESLLRTMDKNGSKLQPPCGWRPDVVSYVSQPLEKDIDILGKISVRLYVSSSAEDTAFTAKLMEVYPDGNAYNIRSGITTLAYRESAVQDRSNYTPGVIVEANISLWDISWRLHKGSMLRIDISSSDCPQYSVHTNKAGIWSLQDSTVIARQTIYSGAVYPSRVILPVDGE